jgi:replication factor A1
MAKSVSADAISTILANPSPESSADVPEIVVQVVDLKATGTGGSRIMCDSFPLP